MAREPLTSQLELGAGLIQSELVHYKTIWLIINESSSSRTINKALFRSLLVNPVNTKKSSHRMFRHMHGVLNEVYLQNILHRWAVNRETNLMILLNP